MAIKKRIPLSLLVFTFFLIPPPSLQGQVGSCWICDSVEYPNGYYYSSCSGAYEGYEECSQDGGLPASACSTSGDECLVATAPDGTATDLGLVFVDPGILGVFTSEVQGNQGARFFLRPCDGAVVRRLYTPEQKQTIRVKTQRISI